jgi:hypothetical protein
LVAGGRQYLFLYDQAKVRIPVVASVGRVFPWFHDTRGLDEYVFRTTNASRAQAAPGTQTAWTELDWSTELRKNTFAIVGTVHTTQPAGTVLWTTSINGKEVDRRAVPVTDSSSEATMPLRIGSPGELLEITVEARGTGALAITDTTTTVAPVSNPQPRNAQIIATLWKAGIWMTAVLVLNIGLYRRAGGRRSGETS